MGLHGPLGPIQHSGCLCCRALENSCRCRCRCRGQRGHLIHRQTRHPLLSTGSLRAHWRECSRKAPSDGTGHDVTNKGGATSHMHIRRRFIKLPNSFVFTCHVPGGPRESPYYFMYCFLEARFSRLSSEFSSFVFLLFFFFEKGS